QFFRRRIARRRRSVSLRRPVSALARRDRPIGFASRRHTMKSAARLAVMVVPLLWSYPAMTEEGAVASAPLPPPLPTARSEPSLPPAVAVLPDRPTDEKGGSPKPEFDQPKTPSPQSRSSVSTPSPRTRTAHKKDARRSRGRASAESVDLVGRPAPDA